jgi:hypothetical protein
MVTEFENVKKKQVKKKERLFNQNNTNKWRKLWIGLLEVVNGTLPKNCAKVTGYKSK